MLRISPDAVEQQLDLSSLSAQDIDAVREACLRAKAVGLDFSRTATPGQYALGPREVVVAHPEIVAALRQHRPVIMRILDVAAAIADEKNARLRAVAEVFDARIMR